jgi:8-oxo-dGTP diphosphatase
MKEHKPVKAVVVTVITRDNKILLGKRSIEPHKNKWGLPGGYIDYAETPEQAIIREVKEELDVTLKPKFKTYYNELMDDHHHVVLIFEGQIKEEPKPNQETSEVNWFDIEEAKDMDLAYQHNKIIKTYLEESK